MASENTYTSYLPSSQESNLMSDGTYNDIVRDLPLDPMSFNFVPFETKYSADPDFAIAVEDAPQIQIPTNEEFVGQFNFELLPDERGDTKTWVYSQKLKKVFIEMGKTLPIRVRWTPAHSGLYLNAVMMFSAPEQRHEMVKRCHNHIGLSSSDVPYLHHVVSCKNTNSIYNDLNGRYSVMVPLGTPQPGTDSVQVDYVFHCKNSCCTGINRRHTELVFNLETEMGHVVGRQKLHVRICSCPKRDKEKEEKVLREECPPSKKRKISISKKLQPILKSHEQSLIKIDQEIMQCNFKIFGKENFRILKTVAHGLMAGSIARGANPCVVRPLMEELFQVPN